MVRSIIYAWPLKDLLTICDSFGTYDFSYLRIDFERSHNVGYGFVNFVDAESIIAVCKAFQNKDWYRGMNLCPKYGQISYATIQGYDCLVEKFRNSAIMDECPGYRPKLWYTFQNSPDPALVGDEMTFPAPNNFTKKQRSQDNAGTIGLYASRSGHRGGDRGGNGARHSQFDRGTTRQIAEDQAYYAHAAGPAFAGNYVAPIGTPAAGMFPQQAGFAPMGQQYPAAFPQMNGMGGYNMPYAAPYAGMQYGGFQGYPAVAPQAPNGYHVVNHASNLRTMSNGRLAGGRPRNTRIAPASRYDPLPSPTTGIVPRSMVYTGNGETGYQYPIQQQAAYQYAAANNGNAQGTGAASGVHFNYPQY